jgi:hypothetical protein
MMSALFPTTITNNGNMKNAKSSNLTKTDESVK